MNHYMNHCNKIYYFKLYEFQKFIEIISSFKWHFLFIQNEIFFFFVLQIIVRPLQLKYYNEAIIAFVLTSYFIECMHSLEWANFYPSEKHYFLAAETCGTNITHPLSKHFYFELYGFRLIKNFIRNISNENTADGYVFQSSI